MSLLPLSTFPRWLLGLILLALAGNIITLFSIGILPDEAYYWVWSQRLELSYFDHPPLIAWFESITTLLLGNNLLAVRLPALLSWLVGALLAYRLSQRMFGGHAGALAVLVWSSLPIVQAGFHVATPDSVLIIFSWLTLWFAWRAGNESSPTLWMLTGAMAGLAMLGKYPAVLVLGSVFCALLASRSGRAQLRTPWPWLAAAVSVVVYAPVIIWNWQHDWLSFAFQFGHGVQSRIDESAFTLFMFFLGGQMFAAMPWTLFAMMFFSFGPTTRLKERDDYGAALLFWAFWLPLLVFGLAGLTSKSGPNWPETAYISGSVILAGGLNHWLFARQRTRMAKIVLIISLFLFSVLLVNALRFPQWIKYVADEDFTPKRTQLSQNYGWDGFKPELEKLLRELPPDCQILVDNHARAGMVAWLLEQPRRVTTTASARFSQYDVWRQEQPGQGDYCLYIDQYDAEFDRKGDIPQRVELPEGHFEQLTVVTAANPDLSLRWFSVYRRVTD